MTAPTASGGLRVVVVGATGALGSEVLSVLDERRFPVAEIVPVATDRSLGVDVEFRGGMLIFFVTPKLLAKAGFAAD